LTPSFSDYITDGTIVQFTSSGSLPYPLLAGADYTVKMSGNSFSLLNNLGNPVVFSNNGVPTLPIGQLSTNIVRQFTPQASTTLTMPTSLYETGNKISVRANEGDTLPYGLVASTYSAAKYYYVRRSNNLEIELYDTLQHAIDPSGLTTGRLSYQNTGNTVDSTFFVDAVLPPILVKNILHIEKPITAGYVSLYAFDYGRSNDMTLIGQYHPSETNPKYRRIRIGKQCSWARIIYRVKAPVITSEYDYIPVENTRAILAAVHAVDLEDKDFMEQSMKYWAAAVAYLRSQTESMEGHAMMPPQINNVTYGDKTDCVIM
jgi:hypothetical protein